jgi:hypothetical protein
MTEVDNQDAAGAEVCKIVGLALRCERKATDRIFKDLKQLLGGAGTQRRSAARTERLDGAIQRGAEYRYAIDIPARSQMLSTAYPAWLDSSVVKSGHAKPRTRGSFIASKWRTTG